jgi:hypothetical protein
MTHYLNKWRGRYLCPWSFSLHNYCSASHEASLFYFVMLPMACNDHFAKMASFWYVNYATVTCMLKILLCNCSSHFSVTAQYKFEMVAECCAKEKRESSDVMGSCKIFTCLIQSTAISRRVRCQRCVFRSAPSSACLYFHLLRFLPAGMYKQTHSEVLRVL